MIPTKPTYKSEASSLSLPNRGRQTKAGHKPATNPPRWLRLETFERATTVTRTRIPNTTANIICLSTDSMWWKLTTRSAIQKPARPKMIPLAPTTCVHGSSDTALSSVAANACRCADDQNADRPGRKPLPTLGFGSEPVFPQDQTIFVVHEEIHIGYSPPPTKCLNR